MLKFYENKKILVLYSLIIFFLTAYFIYINFYNESGYWYDEWCTLLSSDPNVDLDTIFDRHRGNSEKPYENVPILYYLILRFFFNIFGYTAENGRIFSLIFLIFSSIIFYFLMELFTKKRESLFATSIFISTPLILWMSNETRVDLFVVFFVLINVFIFFLVLKYMRTDLNILLFVINFITLSIYPLTISIIGSQFLFLIFKRIFKNSKNNLTIFFTIFSLILYFIFNYDYFIERSLNRDYHFATLNLNFFILYYFNIFFGSIFFGVIFFLLFLFFLISQNKKIIKDELLLFCVISIFLTYLMVIISSTLVTPIAAPRYIIFIIPLILIFIIKSLINFKNKSLFFLFLFIISIFNVSTNYDNRHIKKPPTAQALDVIKKYSVDNILMLPQSILYQNYISTISNSKNYKLFLDFEELKIKEVQTFAVLCLFKPRFAGDQNTNKYEYCNEDYKGFLNFSEIEIPDYKIKFFKKIK